MSNDDASRNQPIAAPDDIDIEISFQDSDLNLDDDSDQYVANDTQNKKSIFLGMGLLPSEEKVVWSRGKLSNMSRSRILNEDES